MEFHRVSRRTVVAGHRLYPERAGHKPPGRQIFTGRSAYVWKVHGTLDARLAGAPANDRRQIVGSFDEQVADAPHDGTSRFDRLR